MNLDIEQFIHEIESEIERIWLKEPEDIYALRNGYLPSGAGIYNQFFSVQVMVSGEIRALGIHIFSDLLHFSQSEEFTIEQLIIMAKQMLKIDVGVISYFGLELYGHNLQKYVALLDKVNDKTDFIEMTQTMFTYTNRYQMWLHQVFPWGVSTFFKQQSTKSYKRIIEKIEVYEKKKESLEQ